MLVKVCQHNLHTLLFSHCFIFASLTFKVGFFLSWFAVRSEISKIFQSPFNSVQLCVEFVFLMQYFQLRIYTLRVVWFIR